MSKLIEQFLTTHRQCAAQGSVFNQLRPGSLGDH